MTRFFAGLVIVSAAACAQTAQTAAGHWLGKILIPEHEMGVSVDLAQNAKGAWIGSMTILGSTSVDVPLNTVTVDGAAVTFTAGLPGPTKFQGRLLPDAGGLSGTASSAAGEAPFQLSRSGEPNVKVPPPSSPLSQEFNGAWEGTIEAGGKVRRIGLRLSSTPDGVAAATLIAIEQGNLEIPVATVTITGKEIQLEVRAISGAYRGTLGATGEIEGQWAQGQTRAPLTFKRASAEPKK